MLCRQKNPLVLINVLNIHAPTEDKIDYVKWQILNNFRINMEILLRDFNAKVGREDIFKLTAGN
jgi:hypothetical protein